MWCKSDTDEIYNFISSPNTVSVITDMRMARYVAGMSKTGISCQILVVKPQGRRKRRRENIIRKWILGEIDYENVEEVLGFNSEIFLTR
jgi:hypothetical protein